jgi:hypothetical protein
MTCTSTGLSIPLRIAHIIDSQKDDLTGSRYVLRLIEKALYEKSFMNVETRRLDIVQGEAHE